jgi:hypothetical protein
MLIEPPAFDLREHLVEVLPRQPRVDEAFMATKSFSPMPFGATFTGVRCAAMMFSPLSLVPIFKGSLPS